MIKILGICGSPHNGSTEYALRTVLDELSMSQNVETELLLLRGKKISPCTGCRYCKNNNCACCIKDDMPELMETFSKADGYLVASPVYMMGVTPQLSAFFSRLCPLDKVYGNITRNRFGAAFALGGARNGGQELTIYNIFNYLSTLSINMVSGESGCYAGGKIWTQDGGAAAVKNDVKGMESVMSLAHKLSEVVQIYQTGLQNRIK